MRQIIGIDGGGTSTKATLYEWTPDGVGRPLRQAESGASNLNSNTPEQVRANLAELYAALAPEEAVGTGLGVAGVTTPGVTERLETYLRELGYPEPYVIVGDYATALRGALGRNPGILLIAGTGSIAYSQTADGQLARAGGYGHLISDGGSAYAIGQAILAAYVQAYDGTIEQTALLRALEAELGATGKEALGRLMERVYALPFDKSRIASLARLLEPQLALRDPLAQQIADDGARALHALVHTVAQPLAQEQAGRPIRLVFAGGMLLHNPQYRALALEQMQTGPWTYALQEAAADAMVGAADLAAEAVLEGKG